MASEVIGLVHAVRELGEADRNRVRAALDRALPKLRTIPQEPGPRGAVRYFQARIRCPFLDPNDVCRIYESRPLACRTHTVVATDPANCGDLRRLVRMVESEQVHGQAWIAMRDRVGTPTDDQKRPMLVLGALPVFLAASWHLVEQTEPPSIEQVLAAVVPERAKIQGAEQVGP